MRNFRKIFEIFSPHRRLSLRLSLHSVVKRPQIGLERELHLSGRLSRTAPESRCCAPVFNEKRRQNPQTLKTKRKTPHPHQNAPKTREERVFVAHACYVRRRILPPPHTEAAATLPCNIHMPQRLTSCTQPTHRRTPTAAHAPHTHTATTNNTPQRRASTMPSQHKPTQRATRGKATEPPPFLCGRLL